jgi:hypothetical protein
VKLFFDNDAIKKLAEADLLSEAVSIIRASGCQVYVLSTARFKFHTHNETKGAKKFGIDVHRRIRDFIAAAQVARVVEGADYDVLAAVVGIDPGEAILFAAAAAEPSALLITGDKTSIRALSNAATCATIARALKRRVICVEQIVSQVIEAKGFQYVRQKIASSAIHDGSLKLVFSRGLSSREADVREGLASFIRDLRHDSGDLLAT